eukprot:8159434-Heterocapsa_arctica.AAC.1
MALREPACLHVGTDSAYVITTHARLLYERGRALLGGRLPAYHNVENGDVISVFAALLEQRGWKTLRLTKVAAHQKIEDVR